LAQIENKQYLGSNFYTLSLFFLIFSVFNYSQEVKQIEIVYAGSFDRNEKIYPEGNILNEDQIKKVHLRHEEMNIFSKRSIFFQKQNSVIAIGEVYINQGDTLKLYCDSLNYNGTNKKMYAHGNVKLLNNEMELNSKNLELDRVNNEAFFYDGGRIIDSLSDISSINGKYFIDNKKYVFKNDVVVKDQDRLIESEMMDYYLDSEKTYFYKKTSIYGDGYVIKCNSGFYEPRNKQGVFVDNASIDFDSREIYGDSIFFDEDKGYSSISNNIKIIDTNENLILNGEFAEFFQEKDSAIITKNPLAINILKNDSLFIKADTLFSVGKEDVRKMRGLNNVMFVQGNLSGKSDYIQVDKKSGITTMLRKKISERDLQILTEKEINSKNPVIWDNYTQMSGDKIIFTEDLDTNELDSIKIPNNVFIIEEDSIGDNKYNQIKGLKLFGNFIDNKLDRVKIDQNSELIYYMYDENSNLIGVDKAVASSILIYFKEKGMDQITFITNPEGVLYPEEFLDENETFLNGFINRESEKINKKQMLIVR